MRKSVLHIFQILGWADEYKSQTGRWPSLNSGHIDGTEDETWSNVDQNLRLGLRGLAKGQSLARLLLAFRGRRHRKKLPVLSISQILDWADAHHARTGRWPTGHCGPITEAQDETWTGIEMALSHGQRGFPGGNSIARVLAQYRGIRTAATRPKLTHDLILELADAHHGRTGCWPTLESGQVAELPGETWMSIDRALRRAGRGISDRSSLVVLLAVCRDVPPRGWSPLLARRLGDSLST